MDLPHMSFQSCGLPLQNLLSTVIDNTGFITLSFLLFSIWVRIPKLPNKSLWLSKE